jgi:predicted DNA-binding transcriptional regulator AlpA
MPQRSANQGKWKRELAGIAEVAEILGVSKSSVSRWAAEGLLPEPVDNLELGRVWRVAEIKPLKAALPSPAGRARGKALRQNAEHARRHGLDMRKKS